MVIVSAGETREDLGFSYGYVLLVLEILPSDNRGWTSEIANIGIISSVGVTTAAAGVSLLVGRYMV